MHLNFFAASNVLKSCNLLRTLVNKISKFVPIRSRTVQFGLAVTKKLGKPYNFLQLLLRQLVVIRLYYKTIIPLAFVVYV